MRTVLFVIVLLLSAGQAGAQYLDTIVLGTHPWAARQKTAMGKQLSCLYGWRDKLYAGYGDYGANTGPIVIAPFDPIAKTFDSVFTANTEAIYNYREIFGRLFTPAIDRRSYSEPGDYFAMDSSFHWHAYNAGSTTHAFDMATLTGSDLWIFGAQNATAIAFRALDSGRDWSHATIDDKMSGVQKAVVDTDFSRFYFGAIYHGKLYVQARDFYAGMQQESKCFDGVTWTAAPDLTDGNKNMLGWRPVTFHDAIVYRGWEPSSYSLPIYIYDETTGGHSTGLSCYDFTVDGDTLYAVINAGASRVNLMRTADLSHWSTLGRLPSLTRSIARLSGHTYIGTADSRILEIIVPSLAVTGESRNRWDLRLFPNPVVGRTLEVEWERADASNARYAVRDLLGRERASGVIPAGTTHLTIPTAALVPGEYDFLLILGLGTPVGHVSFLVL